MTKSNVKTFFLLLFLNFFLTGCFATTDVQDELYPRFVILSYKDFGPQPESLLGVYHWQWPDAENRPRRPIEYDIKVVVYRDISLEEIEKKFPVIPEKKQDYRYIEYEAAALFLDKRIYDMYAYLEMPSRIEESEADQMYNTLFFHTLIIDLYKTSLKIERAIKY